MACPVNAVDITATIITAGNTVSTRSSPSPPNGSRHSPTSSVMGMNMVSSNCSPLRSSSTSSIRVWAASIRAGELGLGRGVNVPGANTASRHPRISRPVSSRKTSSRRR